MEVDRTVSIFDRVTIENQLEIEIDPKISEIVPELPDIYKRWLLPIQTHHAAFSTMEGMAEFAVQNILQDDNDFKNYLTTFMGTDFSSYKVRKNYQLDKPLGVRGRSSDNRLVNKKLDWSPKFDFENAYLEEMKYL